MFLFCHGHVSQLLKPEKITKQVQTASYLVYITMRLNSLAAHAS